MADLTKEEQERLGLYTHRFKDLSGINISGSTKLTSIGKIL